MNVHPQFPTAPLAAGMYESFYLRAVSPDEPLGAWIRYTVEKAPGRPARGSLWVTVFDASAAAPFMHKHSSEELAMPADGWIAIGADSHFGPTRAQGQIQLDEATPFDTLSGNARTEQAPGSSGKGDSRQVRWTLDIHPETPELRHFKQPWLYRTPLPRTKLTSPAPAASFDGTIELPDRTLRLDGWRGMVGHNWGSEHAERWIWLHGIDFREDSSAWLDVALGRVLVAGRLTPWIANGAICVDGRRARLGGLGARGLRVAESPARCTLTLPCADGSRVEAHVDTPPGSSAGWRYTDPGDDNPAGGHQVVNCSVASLALNVRPREAPARTLHTAHGAAYELGRT
ncbi:MAG TPA: hypothetical protein VK701_06475 [Solirubrobacteraceae bacterium]|jgi:hypothetical protein|nr:hypothetical protein [Solirubrobacteraceae bacterium]